MIIDCDRCTVRGLACANCAITFIVGQEAPPSSQPPAQPPRDPAAQPPRDPAGQPPRDPAGQPPRDPAGRAAEVELDAADIRALTALASAGLIPPLRYAPALARAS